MAPGLPDLVDCARLAEEAAVLERVYELGELGRLRDLLAAPVGILRARFDFAKFDSGRCGAKVQVHAAPQLMCQRCLHVFALEVDSGSEIEFTPDELLGLESEREFFQTDGLVSLRALAEEELLLALPIAAKCETPLTCGNALKFAGDAAARDVENMRRPFSALQDLLKKT
jgi:uncharacterized metal-binding protein YceD (DUF177 family)